MRIILAILIIVFGSICIGFCGFQDCKLKKRSSNNWLLLGIICLAAGMLLFYFDSCRLEMRRRLNAPIISEAQLYGYQITNKRWVIKKSSDDEPFSIDIKNILPFSRGTFKNVEVSEEIYPKLLKGKSYLPENDPNAPAPALQDQ